MSVSERARVVIADDHPIFRGGLRQVLRESPSISLEGEAEDGEAALNLIRELDPDVAVLDMAMPRLDGMTILRKVRQERLRSAVVFLTLHSDAAVLEEALSLGARGYVLKDSVGSEIVHAVEAAVRGEVYVSPQLLGALSSLRARQSTLSERKPGLAELTPSERRVLALVADGKSSREIAEALFVSVRTVENHRAAMAVKLDLHGAHALARFAVAHRSELG